ncbi:hypothetical protein ACFCW6_05020 [Streptomyces sp. NPDC056333]|uniref:hypothetical protein n=1 Tax=Streptomyces sp. NPDC056333 TaxID=3345786 RepID=UPI0035E1FDA0
MTDEVKEAPGPNRRTVLEVGFSGAVVAAAAGLPLATAGPVAAAPGVRNETGYVTVSGLGQGTHGFTLVRES